MRHLVVSLIWFTCSASLLIASLGMYMYGQTRTPMTPEVAGASRAMPIAEAREPAYILEPEELDVFTNDIVAADARPKIVAAFLERYSCPLRPYDYYADQFVQAADRHHLDFRLLPAISMQESNCCKRIPEGSNNCWGYGIYGDKVTRFPSYEEGMERVAQTLEEKYVQKGLLEPEEIMSKYTPSSKGSWAVGVLHFMGIMKETTLRSAANTRS